MSRGNGSNGHGNGNGHLPASRIGDLADRLPPQALASERAVIGSILIDNDQLAGVVEVLQPEDFYRDAHQVIWRAILALHERGVPVDPITLADELERRGQLDRVGDVEFLSEVIGELPHAANAVMYARAVREAAISHRIVEGAQEVLNDGYSRNFTAPELLDRLRGLAAQVEEEASLELASGWAAPNLDGLPPPVPFPFEVLPPGLADYLGAVAHSMCCPADFVAVFALTAAGAAIGRSVAIRVKPDWEESPCLFTAVVGSPGSIKSPSLKRILTPLYRRASELRMDHALLKGQCQQARRDYDSARKDWEVAKRTKGSTAPPPVEPDTTLPPLQRVVIIESTCEALAPILQDNPRGLIMARDELSGWLSGLNQYKSGKGNDRDFWLSIWNGATITIDRKGHEDRIPIHVPHPFCAVTGAMTPDKLRSLPAEDQADDGFVDRILFTFPGEVSVRWRDEAPPEELVRDWSEALGRLWSRQMILDADDGQLRPYFVQFTPPAREAFAAWFDAHVQESEEADFSRHLKGPWSKLRGYCARLALILDQLAWAYDPTAPDRPDAVGLTAVEGAIVLIDYFKAHLQRVLAVIHQSDYDNLDARAILQWILKGQRRRFAESEARDCFRRRFASRPDDLREALVWLVQRNVLRKIPPPALASVGRKPGAKFETNPQIFEKRAPNSEVIGTS